MGFIENDTIQAILMIIKCLNLQSITILFYVLIVLFQIATNI